MTTKFLTDEDWFGRASLKLMHVEDFAAELEDIWQNVGSTEYPIPPGIKDTEWKAIIRRVLPENPGQLGSAAWCQSNTKRETSALGGCRPIAAGRPPTPHRCGPLMVNLHTSFWCRQIGDAG